MNKTLIAAIVFSSVSMPSLGTAREDVPTPEAPIWKRSNDSAFLSQLSGNIKAFPQAIISLCVVASLKHPELVVDIAETAALAVPEKAPFVANMLARRFPKQAGEIVAATQKASPENAERIAILVYYDVPEARPETFPEPSFEQYLLAAGRKLPSAGGEKP